MEIGFAGLPRRLETIVEIAQRAEAAGVRWFGVADSPVLFTDPYAAIQAILGATSTMRVWDLCHESGHASLERAGLRLPGAGSARPGQVVHGHRAR